ncbi:MAG: aspartate/tyrosine/aromatic aminotransferase [Opitutales bacterium]|nr:aspartate/tyrosine/aromatic aminotransferase [Opitutales bacterium]
MFEHIQQAAPDPILGLTEAFKADPRPEKINLSVGIYKDATGATPVMRCVKKAEQKLLDKETTKNYLEIPGAAEFAEGMRRLNIGEASLAVTEKRVFSAHTPGGTGALRVAADFIKSQLDGKKVWLTSPTWPNHGQVFAAAGVETDSFPWFDAANNVFAEEKALDAINKIPEGDIVLLHGCCHNPCGADPTGEQWKKIAEVLSTRNLLPLVDFAYQGLGDGLDEDRRGVEALLETCPEMIICSSCSKNFGLYRERVGAIHLVCKTADQAKVAGSQLKRVIRSNYSNPPAHGELVVAEVLQSEELTKIWIDELDEMRARIQSMRTLFVKTLKEMGCSKDFSFLEDQRGMFSFSGLGPEQVDLLRDKHAIYIVRSGRINVAGMTESNMPKLCQAIMDVL